MSGDDPWDVIGGTIGSVLGTTFLGPAGGVLGGILGGHHERTVEGHPVAAPAPPPAPPAPGAGSAADAAEADTKAMAHIMDHLKELDDSAASTVDAIHSAGAAGQKALEEIQKDVDAKIAELGPRLNTPDGQKELREFLKDKLGSAKQIIDEQIADAEAKAKHTREMTQHYLDVAGGGDKTKKDDDSSDKKDVKSAGDPGSGGGSGGSGADPGTTPAAAPGAQPAASPYGPGGMPGAGMMPAGFPGMPSLGGGGIPGLGGGDPLGGLGGLGGANAHNQDPGFQDGSDHPDSDSAKFHDASGKSSDSDSDGGDAATKPAADHGSGAHAEPAASQTTQPGEGSSAGGTHVALPDGTSSDARTTQGAAATRAALGGASVADAWQQAGVTVPPPGTPVTEPIPPTKLQAGDVGVWQDHLVMALGNGKVLVSGQEQPLESVSTGPDFLGWMDPSAGAGKGAIHGASATPPPTQPPAQPS
jgi:hypothetical protein